MNVSIAIPAKQQAIEMCGVNAIEKWLADWKRAHGKGEKQMSSDDYESRREQRREEERQYRGDVIYEVWRRGGDSDRVDYDRLSDYRSQGHDASHAASRELARMKPRQQEKEPEEQQFDGHENSTE